MKDGYIKVAAATPKVKVADTVYNGQLIKALMKECTDNGAKVVVFPELCITGYTCQDLFWQDKLIAAAEDELIGIADYSRSLDGIFFIGLPYEINGMLYNMAAVVSRGEVLAMVPKTFLPNYNEFYEARHFASGENLSTYVTLKNGQQVSVDTDFIFSCSFYSLVNIPFCDWMCFFFTKKNQHIKADPALPAVLCSPVFGGCTI